MRTLSNIHVVIIQILKHFILSVKLVLSMYITYFIIGYFRYLSFHCSLYPSVKWCNVNINSIDDVTDIMFKSAVSTFK